MGCCGVSVKDDEKKQNIQVFKPYNGQNPVTINIKGNQKTINNLEISNNTKDKISTELNQEKKDENKTLKTNHNINTTNNINKFNANNNIYQEKLAKKITILDNVKEYLPEDISMEEIREIVFNAIGNYIVDKSEYKKGVNLTEEQAEVICDILFNHIIGNNEEKDDLEILDDVKLKMGFCDVNRDNIKNIMFRGQNPTKEEIEDVYMQFKSIISPKLFVIELIE